MDYLFQCRWPEGFVCPRCKEIVAWPIMARKLWERAGCHYQVSLTAGTVLHKMRTPLHLWFWVAYLMTTGTPGISASQLQRQVGRRDPQRFHGRHRHARRHRAHRRLDGLRALVQARLQLPAAIPTGRGGRRKAAGGPILRRRHPPGRLKPDGRRSAGPGKQRTRRDRDPPATTGTLPPVTHLPTRHTLAKRANARLASAASPNSPDTPHLHRTTPRNRRIDPDSPLPPQTYRKHMLKVHEMDCAF